MKKSDVAFLAALICVASLMPDWLRVTLGAILAVAQILYSVAEK